ncbi:MAG: hypothetical protein GDA54_06845 [Alphaproteobacteria bacterium GM7ARS4]|nr:hypothetical protein [Alphaproteobacteria bacterium GM7ARS4]
MRSLGLGILSWRGSRSLRKALMSYAYDAFLDLFDERCIVFQECREEDRRLAEEFAMPYKGYKDNQGILGGFERLVDALSTDYMLLLEEDWILVEDVNSVSEQLRQGLASVASGETVCYSFRHRWQRDDISEKGVSQYRRYYPVSDSPLYPSTGVIKKGIHALKQRFHPVKARRLRGRAVYVERAPHAMFPHIIHETDHGSYLVDSEGMDWSNNNVLVSRQFIKEKMFNHYAIRTGHRNGFGDIEHSMKCGCEKCQWWQGSHFKLGIRNPGLFRHAPVGYRTKKASKASPNVYVGNT